MQGEFFSGKKYAVSEVFLDLWAQDLAKSVFLQENVE